MEQPLLTPYQSQYYAWLLTRQAASDTVESLGINDALMRVRVSHDLIHWVRFFLQGVAETAAKGRDDFAKY